MSEIPPTATEESGHIWIDTAGGQVNLTAEIGERAARAIWDAKYPTGTSWDDWAAQMERNPDGFDGREECRRLASAAVSAILSIPHIAKALDRLTPDLAPLHNLPEL